MNILMISTGDLLGDALERHVAYARRANGQVHMVTYSSRQTKNSHLDNRFFLYPFSGAKVGYLYRGLKHIAQICRGVRFDLIYTQDPFGTAALGLITRKFLKVPVVIGNHSNFIDNPLWIAERPFFFSTLNSLAKCLLPYANAWRVLNQHERGVYIEKLRLPANHIYVINTPVNLDRFSVSLDPLCRGTLRGRLGIPPRAPVLLWIGRPVRVKRLPILFAAFKLLTERRPDARLVLIGDARLQQENLRDEIRSLKLDGQVLWLDYPVSHADLPLFYQIADVFVHTSNYEGFGKVIVEASASGIPTVATDTAGARSIILDNQTGFIVPVDDIRTLAERLEWVLAEPRQAQVLGLQAKRHVMAKFNKDENISAIVNMWERVKNANV